MRETEKELLHTTMDIVAEKGLDGFSMKRVTNRVGVAESLIYKYFETKENLLKQCFMYVNGRIADLFSDVRMPSINSPEDIEQFLRGQWERYFYFMVDNGKHSMFYYIYRESNYLQDILMRNNAQVAKDMEKFMELTNGLLAQININRNVPMDYIWLYILEGTGMFVKQVIRQDLKREEIDIDSIWLLMYGGLKGLANK